MQLDCNATAFTKINGYVLTDCIANKKWLNLYDTYLQPIETWKQLDFWFKHFWFFSSCTNKLSCNWIKTFYFQQFYWLTNVILCINLLFNNLLVTYTYDYNEQNLNISFAH